LRPRLAPATLLSRALLNTIRSGRLTLVFRRNLYRSLLLALAVMLPHAAGAQSDDSVSLGKLARALRKTSKTASPVLIDNDNLTSVMDEVESHRLNGSPLFSMQPGSDRFSLSTPDGTCSLAFNANTSSLVTAPFVADDLPAEELAKLDGPATLDGDTLQVS